MTVRELELDLDAFEGPFDLLLTLVLREELEPRDVDVAEVVITFVERLAEREQLDLEACGEFLILVGALLELKARELFPEERVELADLDPEEAAEELARRLEDYRRMKEAAGWLMERLAVGAGPLLPARARRRWRRRPSRGSRRRSPESLARALRLLATPPPEVSLVAHGAALPAGGAVPRALPRAAAPPAPVRLRAGGDGALAGGAGGRVPRRAGAPPVRRDHDRAGLAVRADSDRRAPRKE